MPGGRRTLLSAGTGNELIAVLRALQRMEIEGFTAYWSDGNVEFRRKDRTRDGEVDVANDDNSDLPVWLP